MHLDTGKPSNYIQPVYDDALLIPSRLHECSSLLSQIQLHSYDWMFRRISCLVAFAHFPFLLKTLLARWSLLLEASQTFWLTYVFLAYD